MVLGPKLVVSATAQPDPKVDGLDHRLDLDHKADGPSIDVSPTRAFGRVSGIQPDEGCD